MAARVVHFGADDCSRLLLLKKSGYVVRECSTSIEKLTGTLREKGADVILFSEDGWRFSREAVEAARASSSAPLVLFEPPGHFDTTELFDVVIPAGTPPPDWLRRVEETIRHAAEIVAASKTVRESSARLREQSGQLRKESQVERLRAERECERSRKDTGEKL